MPVLLRAIYKLIKLVKHSVYNDRIENIFNRIKIKFLSGYRHEPKKLIHYIFHTQDDSHFSIRYKGLNFFRNSTLYFQLSKIADKYILHNYSNSGIDNTILHKNVINNIVFMEQYINNNYNTKEVVPQNCILVIGVHRISKFISSQINKKMLYSAYTENPDTPIYYLSPYADKAKYDTKLLTQFSGIRCVGKTSDLPFLIGDAKKVYVYDSALGVVALIHGKTVVTFGNPEYAGHGFTDDRRKRFLQKTVLDFPNWFGRHYRDKTYVLTLPMFRSEASFEQLLAYSFVCTDRMIYALLTGKLEAYPDNLGPESAPDFQDFLDSPESAAFKAWLITILGETALGKFLLSLVQKNDPTEYALALIQGRNRLAERDFLISLIEILRIRFQLAYAAHFLNAYHERLKTCKKRLRYNQYMDFFRLYRVAGSLYLNYTLPNLYDLVDFSSIYNAKQKHKLLLETVYSLLHRPGSYSNIDKLLSDFAPKNDFEFWKKVVKYFNRRLREPDNNKARRNIQKYYAEKYLSILNRKFCGLIHESINKAIVSIDLNDYSESVMSLHEIEDVVTDIRLAIQTIESVADASVKKSISKRLPELCRQALPFLARLGEQETFFALLKIGNPYLKEKDYYQFSCLYNHLKFYSKRLEVGAEAWAIVSAQKYRDMHIFLGRSEKWPFDRSIQSTVMKCHAMLGNYAEAAHHAKRQLIRNKRGSAARFWTDYRLTHHYSFLRDASWIANSAPQPEQALGVVFIVSLPLPSRACEVAAMTAPLAAELKRAGYAVIHLYSEQIHDDPTGNPILDRYIRLISSSASDGRIAGQWVIDPENRIISCDGFNFYSGIYERIGILLRKSIIDWSSPATKRFLDLLIPQTDYYLRIVKDIYNTITMKGIPTIFLMCPTCSAPSSVFRDFTFFMNDAGDDRIRLVDISVTYQRYGSGMQGRIGHFLDVLDLSEYRGSVGPVIPPRKLFDLWYQKHKVDDSIAEQGRKLLANNVVNKAPDHIPASLAIIQQAKRDGKKVVCLYGRLTADFGLPRNEGPAHNSMRDWLNHSIQVLGGREDFLVLVKPHPSEENTEISTVLFEKLRELLPDSLPDNSIYLQPSDYTNKDLYPYLTLAISWFGTASVEATAFGLPVLICSHFGRTAYPIDMIYPKSREGYEEYLLRGEYAAPSQETCHRALALLSCIAHPPHACPWPYTAISIVNYSIQARYWHLSKLERYRQEGDPHLARLAARITEFVPSVPKALCRKD